MGDVEATKQLRGGRDVSFPHPEARHIQRLENRDVARAADAEALRVRRQRVPHAVDDAVVVAPLLATEPVDRAPEQPEVLLLVRLRHEDPDVEHASRAAHLLLARPRDLPFAFLAGVDDLVAVARGAQDEVPGSRLGNKPLPPVRGDLLPLGTRLGRDARLRLAHEALPVVRPTPLLVDPLDERDGRVAGPDGVRGMGLGVHAEAVREPVRQQPVLVAGLTRQEPRDLARRVPRDAGAEPPLHPVHAPAVRDRGPLAHPV